ncbi:MAG TPA: hypothetical protein DCY20_08340 [Firmicutes bacterium]|nr:hypothetical protein [Bacillota bacterium]
MKKIREFILKHRALQIVLIILGLGVLLWYGQTFTMVGIKYEDTFLKRVETAQGYNYIGTSSEGEITVSVSKIKSHNSETLVEFYLPNKLYQSYTVQYQNRNNQISVQSIKDETGAILFTGTYVLEGGFLLLNDNDLYWESPQFHVADQAIFNKDYRVPLVSVLEFATNQSTIRGVFELFFVGLILTVSGVLEYLYPMFFFKLRYMFTVEDPEPTDFYMIVQRICVIFCIVLGLLLLLAALYY